MDENHVGKLKVVEEFNLWLRVSWEDILWSSKRRYILINKVGEKKGLLCVGKWNEMESGKRDEERLKILCLHGFRTNGSFLRKQLSKWDPSIFALFHMVCYVIYYMYKSLISLKPFLDKNENFDGNNLYLT